MKKYEYKAKVIEVIDGDTVKLDVDLGFYTHLHIRGRLGNINAPEGKNTEAAKFLAEYLPVGCSVLISVKKTQEKYGRWVVEIFKEGESMSTSLNSLLLARGLVNPY
jgi:micrococcal nuclease